MFCRKDRQTSAIHLCNSKNELKCFLFDATLFLDESLKKSTENCLTRTMIEVVTRSDICIITQKYIAHSQ